MPEKQSIPINRKVAILQLLPNLISILALCAGLTAIRFAMAGDFGMAVGLICLAAALDGIDGRIARMLKSESAIGAELDSLCDLVNFGVTPAFILYYWGMQHGGSFVWIAVLIYVTSCMLRLARFNASNKVDVSDQKMGFVGVPSPAGAMLALAPIYTVKAFDIQNPPAEWILAIWLLLIGGLMISRVPTPSFKSTRIKRETARFVLVISAGFIAALLTYPWEALLFADAAYLTGVAIAWRKRARSRRIV